MTTAVESYIDNLVENLLRDYEKDNEIIKKFTLPNKQEIIKIVLQLRNIIFSSCFENESQKIYSMKNKLTTTFQAVFYSLSKQISIALKHLLEYERMEDKEINKKSEEINFKFLGKVSKIRDLCQTDLQATFNGDPAAFNKAEIICAYPGLFAITINRIAHELYLLEVPLIPRIMTEYAHAETGVDIHPGATLGKYSFIDHGTGIVIGETAVIGDNVKIYQGVTIGALSTKDGHKLQGQKRHPTIEDNVVIYAGASILGGATVIGQNCIIGGNAFITSSIPHNTKVTIKNQELNYK